MYHVKYQMKEFAMENTFFFNNFKTLASDEKCKKRLLKKICKILPFPVFIG